MAKSEFIQTITERGYLHQATDLEALDAAAAKGPVAAYIGFDCTADSLHVGSLVPIMMLRVLQRTGHKPIVLMGGGTTRVGDPSGRDDQRPLLSDRDIERNKAGIRRVFENYLVFDDGPTGAVMADNAEWLDGLDYIAFLRDFGAHFSVNRMLSMDSVRLRLDREQPLSFLEFNYAILQAYDFLELRRRHGCLLQMGGSDQWGNIVMGTELIRRVDGKQAFGLTTPLITTASGAKMGKTAQGAVWLNRDKLPVWDFWQYWRNTEDADVGRFLRLFTELPLDEVGRLESLGGSEINEAKILLANEATGLCHSPGEAAEAAETARAAFGAGELAEGLPQVELPSPDIGVVDALRKAGLAKTNGEARRLVKGGGARLNGEVVGDAELRLSNGDFDGDGRAKLAAGKKRQVVLKLRG